MSEIKINLKSLWNFKYSTDDEELLTANTQMCPYCRLVILDPVYFYIISNLKKSGLLDKNYLPICCCCLILKRFGLLDIKPKPITFVYSDLYDILTIDFMLNQITKEGKILLMSIRVHDWSKINLFE